MRGLGPARECFPPLLGSDVVQMVMGQISSISGNQPAKVFVETELDCLKSSETFKIAGFLGPLSKSTTSKTPPAPTFTAVGEPKSAVVGGADQGAICITTWRGACTQCCHP